jgi:regulator of replication initiation timing
MRKRAAATTPDELERPAQGDAREFQALAHNLRQLVQENAELRREYEHLTAAWQGENARADQASRQVEELRQRERSVVREATENTEKLPRRVRRWLRRLPGRDVKS